MKNGEERKQTKDGGYSWLVMVAAMITNVMTTGFPMCQALLIVEWYHTFNCSKFAATWTLAITQGATSFIGPVTGGLINMYGCRVVLFTGAVLTACSQLAFAFAPSMGVIYVLSGLTGCSLGLMFSPPIVIIYHYFDKYKSLASGISLTGHSLAAFFMVGVCRLSIDHFGWRGAMFILAGFTLHGCVTAMFMRPFATNASKAVTRESIAQSFDVTVLKDTNFLMYAISNSIQMVILIAFYQLSTLRAVTKGIHVLHASMLPTVVGVVAAISRFMYSGVSNMSCTSHIGVYSVCICGGALTLIVSCFWADNFVFAAVCCAVGGINVGGCMTMVPAVLVDLLGLERLPGAFGWSCVFNGIQFFTIIPLAGYIHDVTGDFNYSFYTIGALGLVAGLLCITVAIKHHRSQRNLNAEYTNPPHFNGNTVELEDVVEDSKLEYNNMAEEIT